MGQQPKIGIGPAEKPRATPEPDPPRRWRPTRPGVITAPSQVPRGGSFGVPGPDTGYAWVLIRDAASFLAADQEKVVAALMAARSSQAGRAPIREDLDVALLVAGIGEGLPDSIVERGRSWAAATTHEPWPGRKAVDEVEKDLLALKPDDVRRRVRIIGH